MFEAHQSQTFCSQQYILTSFLKNDSASPADSFFRNDKNNMTILISIPFAAASLETSLSPLQCHPVHITMCSLLKFGGGGGGLKTYKKIIKLHAHFVVKNTYKIFLD